MNHKKITLSIIFLLSINSFLTGAAAAAPVKEPREYFYGLFTKIKWDADVTPGEVRTLLNKVEEYSDHHATLQCIAERALIGGFSKRIRPEDAERIINAAMDKDETIDLCPIFTERMFMGARSYSKGALKLLTLNARNPEFGTNVSTPNGRELTAIQAAMDPFYHSQMSNNLQDDGSSADASDFVELADFIFEHANHANINTIAHALQNDATRRCYDNYRATREAL